MKTRAELTEERAIALARAEAAEAEAKAAYEVVIAVRRFLAANRHSAPCAQGLARYDEMQALEGAVDEYVRARIARHEAPRVGRAKLLGSRKLMMPKASKGED